MKHLCRLCNSTTIVLEDKKISKTYYRCTECDYIFLDEKYIIDSRLEKKHYDNHNNTLESLGYVKMFKELIEQFIDVKEIKSALDFGCGNGAVLPTLLQRSGISCDKYDLYYFPKKVYVNKTYDLICSTEVLEHLVNPLDTIKELLLHLNKDAKLVIMTYFHPDDNEEFLKWFYIKDITHIGFFSLKTFEYLASKLNIEILKHNNKNTISFKNILTDRL